MARQEKGSRMRMLPPRVQLQQKDAMTGSYPTVVRFSTDGRTGTYPISYNDTYTLNFTSSNVYVPGIGFPVGNIWLNNSQSNDLTGSIVTTGSVRSQIVDDLPFFHFSPGQEMSPFRDSNQPAVDGKSSGDPFYATGSAVQDVGLGFSSPVWSKNKIEIDLTSYGNRRVGGRLSSLLANDTYMIYYNHSTKLWDYVGVLRPATYYVTRSLSSPTGQGTVELFREKAIGWANSWLPTLAGLPQDILHQPKVAQEFGFPYDGKYSLPANSPKLYSLKNIINEPFLVEKIVLQFTASFSSENHLMSWGGGALGSATNTFFILNQRDYNTKAVTQNVTLTPSANSWPVNVTQSYIASGSITNLVSYISLFTPGADPTTWYQNYSNPTFPESVYGPAMEQNKNLTIILPTSSAPTDYQFGKWNGSYQVSASCVSPTLYQYKKQNLLTYPIRLRSGALNTDVAEVYPTGQGNRINTSTLIDGRSYLNPAIGYVSRPFFDPVNNTTVDIDSLSAIPNPYILLPTDNLIFGWQAPYIGYYYERQTTDGIFIFNSGSILPTLNIGPGPAKVILYGSYIREGREYNDGTNQLLSSDSVHEVIE